jgi:hypothetical protein
VTRRKLPRRIIRPVVQAGPATEAGKVCRGCAGGAIPPAHHPRVDGPEGRAEQLPAAPDPPASVLEGKNLCREVRSLAHDEAVAVTSGTEASPIAAIRMGGL